MGKSKTSPFLAIVAVFFFWGFLAASNGIFIPFCKTHFQLSQFQSQLVDSAFYGAYFIGSLLLYLLSLQLNTDIINRIGYKRTIVYGLLLSIIGALVMLPALNSGSFSFILLAFFIIALGFSLQQTSANPLVLNLGDPAKGSHRLNFAGSINSFGTTLGPILVSVILFGKAVASSSDKEGASLSSINTLYIILALAFALAAGILSLTRLPKLAVESEEASMRLLKGPLFFIQGILLVLGLLLGLSAFGYRDTDPAAFAFLLVVSALLLFFLLLLSLQYKRMKARDRVESQRYPQVILGMVAIFVYVGVEVTIQSNLGALLKLPEYGALADAEIGPYISLYWGSLMIGRWTGSLGAFKLSKTLNVLLTVVVPLMAFALVLFMNHLNGAEASRYLPYILCVGVLVAAFFMSRQKPALTLMLFGILGTIAMLVGLFSTGILSIYAFLSGGLFCSIMWPAIFSLSTAGLGKYTSQASAFLIMMILGGAIIPPLQGWIADITDIHRSYMVTVVCFLFLAWFAFYMRRYLRSKGLDYDHSETLKH